MNGPTGVEALLGAEPDGVDAGCAAGFEVLHRYVEAELSGADPSRDLPGLAAHLRRCPACREDYLGLRESADRFGDVGPGAV